MSAPLVAAGCPQLHRPFKRPDRGGPAAASSSACLATSDETNKTQPTAEFMGRGRVLARPHRELFRARVLARHTTIRRQLARRRRRRVAGRGGAGKRCLGIEG